MGYGDLLYDEVSGPLGEVPKRHVGRIREAGWHLLAFVEDSLAHARFEASKEEFRIEPVSTADCARDAAAIAGPLATKKGPALRISVPEGPVWIDTDVRKAKQILLNLVSSAVKFTDRGEVALAVEPAPDGGVLFQVRDNGGGIAPRNLAIIFEAFEQVDPALTRRQQGTGLGLGVSRKLALLLGGGTVRCQRTGGWGSRSRSDFGGRRSAPGPRKSAE